MNANDKLLLKDEVLERTRFTESTLYRLMGEGFFPRPIKIGPKAVRWPQSELEAWIAARPRANGASGRAA